MPKMRTNEEYVNANQQAGVLHGECEIIVNATHTHEVKERQLKKTEHTLLKR